VTWVTITILDEDDNKPEMDKPLYKVSVPENLSVDTYIVQLKATDKDEVSDVSFTYIFIVYLRYVVLLCAVSLFLNRPVL
jgi:hypothetical protein